MRSGRFTLAVASGKGGTGKTLVSTSIAAEAVRRSMRAVLVDCDADAPNDHIFLPRAREHTTRVSAPVALVHPELCTACGECSRVCAYGAVRVLGSSALVFNELCHGCELCVDVCPTGAITMEGLEVGSIIEGPTRHDENLRLVTGVLDIGQVKSPDVIREAVARGRAADVDLVVLDAPPGVACAVVAAVREADALLLVTEPTPFGLHDLELAVELGRELGVPMAILANKVTAENEAALTELARFEDVPVLHTVPFSRRTAEAYARGELFTGAREGTSVNLVPVFDWIGSLSQPTASEVVTSR